MAMNNLLGQRRRARVVTLTALTLAMAVPAFPAIADDTAAAKRVERLEAQVRALQRKVFPGGDSKYFTPEITPPNAAPTATGRPATTPLTDVLSRMESLEAQLTHLTAQVEQNTNRLTKIETRLESLTPPPVGDVPPVLPAPAPDSGTPAPTANLNAMRGTGASTGPSSQRIAAVSAIAKPQTDDAGDDEYSYGFRLWDAKFYPEAQQQLKLTAERYPDHWRISYTRNLLGRAYLDDGKSREAAPWFLQNYQKDKKGERAADSLLYLAQAMHDLKDEKRACIALAEFASNYPVEAVGRLRTLYLATREEAKCN